MKNMRSMVFMIVSIGAAVSLMVALRPRQKPLPATVAELSLPAPTTYPIAQDKSQGSPDGTQLLVVRQQKGMAEILVNDEWRITLPTQDSGITIPLNAWSPDNKYFFVQNGDEYLVLRAKEIATKEKEEVRRINTSFAAAHPEMKIVEVTGWAAPNLLVVNATSVKEAKMSFWFDVVSQKFIRLSTYFE